MEGKVQELITWVATEWGKPLTERAIFKLFHAVSIHVQAANICEAKTLLFHLHVVIILTGTPRLHLLRGVGGDGGKNWVLKIFDVLSCTATYEFQGGCKILQRGGKCPPLPPSLNEAQRYMYVTGKHHYVYVLLPEDGVLTFMWMKSGGRGGRGPCSNNVLHFIITFPHSIERTVAMNASIG